MPTPYLTVLTYSLLKVIHLGALILWIGPALGAWLVLRKARAVYDVQSREYQLIERVFLGTLIIEHLAFITLLASGILMASQLGWWQAEWLQQKLWLVSGIIVLEVIDIALGNWLLVRLHRRRARGQPLATSRAEAFYHGIFTRVALFALPPASLAIIWLAVSKQPL